MLGLLEHQELLNLETQKQMPFTSAKDCKLSEAELLNFFLSRAQSSLTTVFKQMPKLSDEAKQIVNTLKAIQSVDFEDINVPKLTSLIIEIDYIDYKTQLLQALFNIYGDKVLETLIHKIQRFEDVKKTYEMLQLKHFQTINEYIQSIRDMNNDTEEKPNETDRSELPPIDNENVEPGDLTEELSYLYPLFD